MHVLGIKKMSANRNLSKDKLVSLSVFCVCENTFYVHVNYIYKLYTKYDFKIYKTTVDEGFTVIIKQNEVHD